MDAKQPKDITDRADIIGCTRLMYDLIHLALQTDSTRIITLSIQGSGLVPPIEGVTEGYHSLSHHGKDPKKLEQLKAVEMAEFVALGEFLTKLKGTTEEGSNLLDRTMVYYGSNLGNASSHDNKNMPTFLAGGGFRHGQHLAFDQQNNTPLCNLYVSMLQRLGIEADAFASGRTTLKGLDCARGRTARPRLRLPPEARTGGSPQPLGASHPRPCEIEWNPYWPRGGSNSPSQKQ